MSNSRRIAGLLGPTLVVAALSLLFNPGFWPVAIDQAIHNVALIYLSGIILFVVGLAIVRAHNRWSGGWPVLVTVFGWLFLLSGLVRIFIPEQLLTFAQRNARNSGFLMTEAIVILLIGLFLTFKAYRTPSETSEESQERVDHAA